MFAFPDLRARCGSDACSQVVDTARRRGPRRLDPKREKLWAGKGSGRHLALDQACPYCRQHGHLTPACPHCWQALDADIGHVDDHMIAVLGARQAGKSHYLASLLHELLYGDVVGDRWRVEMTAAMRRSADEQLIGPLFHDQRELPATPLGSRTRVQFVLEDQQTRRRILVRFEDHSGEAIGNPERLMKAKFLRYASGVIVLADPLALKPPARGERRAWHHDEPTYRHILDGYRRVLERAPQRADEMSLPLRPDDKYLAVVVTKADLVLHRQHDFWTRPAATSNGQPAPAHLQAGYWPDRAADSEAARRWLADQDSSPLALERAVEGFADVSYFFASSYGYRHKPRAKVIKLPQPLRVHEPLFAMLDRLSAGDDVSSQGGRSSQGDRRPDRQRPPRPSRGPKSHDDSRPMTSDDVL